jgi:uncharacterized protein (UPF0335 family)
MPKDSTVALPNSQSAGEELKQFVERLEHVEAEQADLAEQKKEIMAELKGRGYDTKMVRKLIAERKRDPDDVAEEIAVLEMYREALGMSTSLRNTGNMGYDPDVDEDDDSTEDGEGMV